MLFVCVQQVQVAISTTYYKTTSWRLGKDRLPTRCNLDARGINLDSTRCPLCDQAIEDLQHLFVECPIAKDLWSMVKTWWGMDDYPKLVLDDLMYNNYKSFQKAFEKGQDCNGEKSFKDYLKQ